MGSGGAKRPRRPTASANAATPKRCAPICASARRERARKRRTATLRTDCRFPHRHRDIADIGATRGVDEKGVAAVGTGVGVASETCGLGRQIFETRPRSEEHTSELQSLMRISYAVFCLK